MTTNGSKASIREVYDISNRLETKIDELNRRLAIVEGKAWGISLIVSAAITFIFNILARQVK